MKKTLTLSTLVLSMAVQSYAGGIATTNASFSTEKHIGGRYVKKITSLSKDSVNSQKLNLANSNDGYHIEIEREIEGFAGPVLEKDLMQSKLKVGLGIEFTAGMTFVNSKDVASLKEVDEFSKNNAADYFFAGKALKMEPEENAHFDFFAGLVLAPEIGNFGIWGVATGGWDVNVTKKEKDIVEIDFALINSKMASFYFDKFGSMLSYDLGKSLETGFSLTLNLKDPKAQLAYEKLFKGNVLFAQTESKTNKNIVFTKNSITSKKVKGLGLWVRTPIVAWFLLNSTQHLSSGEKAETNLDTNIKENTLTSSYDEEMTLDFLGLYYGVNRSFGAEFNSTKKEFSLIDNYEVEGNNGNQISTVLSRMLNKTLMNEFFDLEVPSVSNKYYHMKLEVKYNEDFLNHLMSGKIDINQLKKTAEKNASNQFEKILAKFNVNKDHGVSIYNIIEQKRVEEEVIFIASNKIIKLSELMQKSSLENDNKGVIDNFSKLMKYVYKSPALYKAFVDYSKHCGTEINYVIESEAFAKKEMHLEFNKDEVCKL